MRRVCSTVTIAILLLAASPLVARQRAAADAAAAPRASSDPRVGLKPGLRDAGKVARHLELVASMPKPPGFFDPNAPAGEPTPAERPDDDKPEPSTPEPAPSPRSQLAFANSDFAFQGEHLFLGNFNGFNTYDIEDPKRARLIASVVCPGGQGDVSVHGNLLVMSVEETRGRLDCGT